MDAVTWIKGLLASVISGVANAVLSSGLSSAAGSPLNWSQISSVAIGAAVVGAALYLKQSPLPDSTDVTVKTLTFEPAKTTVTTTTIPTIPTDLKDK